MNSFFYDGQENIFNEQGEKVYDPIEDVLIQVDDLETLTSRETYLNAKHPETTSDESSAKKQSKSSNLSPPVKSYNDCNNFTPETFIDPMLESLQEYGL